MNDQHGREQHRQPETGRVRGLGIGDPGECRPCPPDQREHQHRAPEVRPRQVVCEQGGDAGDREHEHEVPQQLDLGAAALGGLLLQTLGRRLAVGGLVGHRGRATPPSRSPRSLGELPSHRRALAPARPRRRPRASTRPAPPVARRRARRRPPAPAASRRPPRSAARARAPSRTPRASPRASRSPSALIRDSGRSPSAARAGRARRACRHRAERELGARRASRAARRS